MELDNPEAKAFLFEIYAMTQGDTEVQVSMYDIGETLGLEKTDARIMAEDLLIQGYADLKTLSGGIGITRQGLDVLQIKIKPESDDESLNLGTGPVLEGQGKEAVEKIIQEIKESIAQTKLPYAQLEEMVMDIKTIEIQMLSPNPKTEVIREVLRSLHNNSTPLEFKGLAEKLNALITS